MNRRSVLKSAWLFLLLVQLLALSGVKPPLASPRPVRSVVHGHELSDDWAWLAQRDDPELPKVLKAEEKYARQQIKPSAKLAKQLYREFTRFMPGEQASLPYLLDGYRYYVRSPRGRVHQVHYRIKDEAGAKEELLLDENKLAKGKPYFSLGLFTVSRDGAKLAYSADYTGDENYTLYLKDLGSGQTHDTGIADLGEALWLNDGRRLLLTTYNDRFQCDQAWLYDSAAGTLVNLYREADPAFDLGIYFSADRNLIFLDASASDSNQIWYLNAAVADPALIPLLDRGQDFLAYPDQLHGVFYLMTDRFDPDQGLYQFDPAQPEAENWREIVPGESGRPLDSYTLMDGVIAVVRRHQGFKRIELYAADGGALLRVISASEPENLDLWFNQDPGATQLLYTRESELRPYTIISHDLATGAENTLYKTQVSPETDYSLYASELLWVPVPGGISLPLRLIKRRDLDPAVPHPLWLNGYGAYGDCEDPYYSDTLFSLLDRGFIYAVAHVRGGGEMGRAWYDGGRTLNKPNTFTDFVASLEYLIDQGYTEPARLVIEGGSAGGLLIGAVLNLVPEKVGLAIADVPFVDLINTMLDPDLPLTLQEYDEWGDPTRPDEFGCMLSYSPYDNVSPRAYPTVLAVTAWNDVRVGYWEALKWVQKLRANTLADNPALFLLRWDEGHTGSNDVYRDLRNYAQIMAYAIQQITGQK